ncbi:DMT family transporter [Agromyces seonyuensis]|uniref:Multidrug DMT transporter permease n=1 Tax=Agromyces seonyuensis TaxID=2662446 RepID=A0A6I4NXW6_9MICO|nr:multidrug DMT transporter permease [Agromyces seonyuensis]
MEFDLAAVVTAVPPQARQFIGIPLALLGAVFLAVGAQLQHRGVHKVEARTEDASRGGLQIRQLLLLLKRPSWLIGTIMLGLAVVLQLSSLYFSPITMVQPLGAIGLVITAIINSRVSHIKLKTPTIMAIVLCVGGVLVFVAVASFTTTSKPVTDRDLITILVILAVVLVALGIVFAVLRHRVRALFYVIAAGILYGFVATLAKVVLGRLQQSEFEWLTWTCVLALLLAAALGGYFVQNAYSSGPPDLVIAGLTVVDPLVAVGIGIIVLDEAAGAPWWAIATFIVSGAVAVCGVFLIAKTHPQIRV